MGHTQLQPDRPTATNVRRNLQAQPPHTTKAARKHPPLLHGTGVGWYPWKLSAHGEEGVHTYADPGNVCDEPHDVCIDGGQLRESAPKWIPDDVKSHMLQVSTQCAIGMITSWLEIVEPRSTWRQHSAPVRWRPSVHPNEKDDVPASTSVARQAFRLSYIPVLQHGFPFAHVECLIRRVHQTRA